MEILLQSTRLVTLLKSMFLMSRHSNVEIEDLSINSYNEEVTFSKYSQFVVDMIGICRVCPLLRMNLGVIYGCELMKR